MMEVEAEEKGESGGVEGVVVDALPYIDHGQYCIMEHSNWIDQTMDTVAWILLSMETFHYAQK